MATFIYIYITQETELTVGNVPCSDIVVAKRKFPWMFRAFSSLQKLMILEVSCIMWGSRCSFQRQDQICEFPMANIGYHHTSWCHRCPTDSSSLPARRFLRLRSTSLNRRRCSFSFSRWPLQAERAIYHHLGVFRKEDPRV